MNMIRQFRTLTWGMGILIALAAVAPGFPAEGRALRFGHYYPDELVLGRTAQRFAAILAELTGGGLRIEVFPRSQLGPPREMFNAMREGSLDITLVPASFLQDIAPMMDILGLPFVFRNYEEVERIFRADSPVREAMLQQLERGGIKGLAFWEDGFRHISTSQRPIKDPWDLKGLRIRTLSDQALVQTFRLLGADPVTMPFAELYPGLQRRVIDGQEGTLETFYQFKLYETQRYLSLTRHAYTILALAMNMRTFSRLSQQEQAALLDAAQNAAEWGRDVSRRQEEETVDKLLKTGMRVEGQPDWEGFRKRVYYDIQAKFVREDGRKLLREIDRMLR